MPVDPFGDIINIDAKYATRDETKDLQGQLESLKAKVPTWPLNYQTSSTVAVKEWCEKGTVPDWIQLFMLSIYSLYNNLYRQMSRLKKIKFLAPAYRNYGT